MTKAAVPISLALHCHYRRRELSAFSSEPLYIYIPPRLADQRVSPSHGSEWRPFFTFEQVSVGCPPLFSLSFQLERRRLVALLLLDRWMPRYQDTMRRIISTSVPAQFTNILLRPTRVSRVVSYPYVLGGIFASLNG